MKVLIIMLLFTPPAHQGEPYATARWTKEVGSVAECRATIQKKFDDGWQGLGRCKIVSNA